MASKLPLIIKNQERLYFFDEIARLLPTKPCGKTVYKWCMEGRKKDPKDKNSPRLHLEYVRRERGFGTTIEAYWRWIAKFNEE